jgi:DNA-binding NarL/FixJ family response regulator
MKPITVLLVEDHEIVREGLRKLLEEEPDIEVVGEAATGRQAMELARQLRPAVVLMDIAMPQLNGLEATRQIRRRFPEAKVLILSAHGDDIYIEQAIAAGAAGFLLKQTSSHVLAAAIRKADSGSRFVNPALRQPLWNHSEPVLNGAGRPKRNRPRLSSREVEVLQLIAEGRANKEIATELGISIKTVEKHRQHLMEKLRLHDTAGLTRYAISAGVIESGVQSTVIDRA